MSSTLPSHSLHPPRPRLTLGVGVTGHRFGASFEPSAVPRIEAQVRDVLARCSAAADAVQRAHAATFSPERPQLVAVSCLAEGGDQLLAQTALTQGWRAEAVLPFAADEYAKDFGTPEVRARYADLLKQHAAVFEIGDPRSEKDSSEAYETAGFVMLDHCDVVVALWDGGESRGRGGTREIVDEAIRRAMPVVWVNTVSDRPPALWDGEEAALLFDGSGEATKGGRLFDQEVAGILSPPTTSEDRDDEEAARRLAKFLAETEKQPPWWAAGYDLMLRLTAHRPFRFPVRLPAVASRRGEWDGFNNALPPSGPLGRDLNDILLTRYLWADHVADRLGRAYRGAYVLNFALAALAVAVGLMVLFFWDSILVKTICAILEFTLIALILAITHAGARGSWHARFLDARRLAEMLRHARVLAPLGRAGGMAGEGAISDPGERWTAWYALATRRELSLPQACADAAYLKTVVGATVEHEVKPQIAYHHNNQHRLHHVHHGLDYVGEWGFYLTGVLCLVWVACAVIYELLHPSWIKYYVKPTLTFLGAVLPAIGAALAGIRAQGDFDASAKRSHATERELITIRDRLTHAPIGGYREAVLLQVWVADAMASDLGSWRSLYANRPLTIPG